MSVITSRLIVQMVDRASGPARRIASSIRGIHTAGAGVARTYTRTVAPVVSRLRGVSSAVALSNPLAGTAAVAGGFGAYKAHEDLLKWSQIINQIRAANPGTLAEDITRFQDAAFGIARERKILSPTDVLVGVNTLIRAGQQAKAISKEVLNPIADAAMLAGESIEWTSEKFINLTSQFGLSTRTAKETAESFKYLADLAQYVSQEAPGSYRDFVEAMSYGGAAARLVKGGSDFLAGAYIALDKAGVKGMRAGVTLRSLLVSLANPKASARGMFAQMGLDLDKFMIRGKAADASQVVARLQTEFGQNFSNQAGNIQKVLDANRPLEQTEALLYRLIERSWTGKTKGGKLRPQDARKLKASINKVLVSGVESFDLEALIEQAAAKGMTFGQLVQMIQGRQALNTQALFGEDVDEATGQKFLNTPLKRMSGFQRDIAAKQAKEMEKGYAGAVGKLQFSWWNFLKKLDEGGVIDKVTGAIDRFGDALVRVADMNFSWSDLGIASIVLLPFVGVLIRIAALIPAVVTGIAAISGAIVAWAPAIAGGIATLIGAMTPVGWAVLAGVAAAGLAYYFREAIGNALGAVAGWLREKIAELSTAIVNAGSAGQLLFNAGAALIQSLWDGLKSKVSELLSWAAGLGSSIGNAIRRNLPSWAPFSLPDSGAAPTPEKQSYRSPAGGPVTITQTFHVQVGGGADAADTARQIKDELASGMRSAMRGIYSDVGIQPA